MSNRRENITAAARALYEYLAAITDAAYGNKRPGLTWKRTSLTIKSCGAFLRWQIFAVSRRVILSADGLVVGRNEAHAGGVIVATGDGEIVLPLDDSLSYHSLEPFVRDGELISVTCEPGPWDDVIAAMIPELQRAKADLMRAVEEYDRAKRQLVVDNRQAQLEAARKAVT